MSFWQENMGFIQDVFDDRAKKLVEVMDKTDKSITDVLADKIYTSNEFKKVKENFTSLAKNMETSEVKEWLQNTRETMGGKGKGDDKLGNVLERFDKMVAKVSDTKTIADSLWQGYNYTDELTPHVEWLEDKKTLANRDINSNSAGETEEHIERQEKVIDQLDKKRKVFQAILDKGTALTQKPKSPEFLAREVKRAGDLWKETNNQALDRLQRLRDNQAAWERYEQKRDELTKKLDAADSELENINQLYNLDAGIEDHKNRVKNAANTRKDIEAVFKTVSDANTIVQILLTDDMKAELNEQVNELKERGSTNDKIEDRLKAIDDFNGKIKIYIGVLVELEKWNLEGRKRMDELLAGPAPGSSAEDRVLMTMELGEDISKQLELHAAQETLWDDSLGPKKAGEVSDESKALVGRMDTVKGALSALNTESETEAAKFGEDVKYLADVTNSTKKFDPWIAKSEEKVKTGMKNAGSLEEGKKVFEEVKHWKAESEAIKTVLDNGNASAQKMTTHGEADKVYAANIKRWETVDKAIKEWITKMEALVKMWEDQAATADKVTNAISDPSASDMKLEDLETHLNSLKEMFIQKQKMMDGMNPPTEA
jgi:hypothetical protein